MHAIIEVVEYYDKKHGNTYKSGRAYIYEGETQVTTYYLPFEYNYGSIFNCSLILDEQGERLPLTTQELKNITTRVIERHVTRIKTAQEWGVPPRN